MSHVKTNPRKVAKNIISEYGKPAFHKLIELFRENESGTKIGYAFNVSRQRVNQWKAVLGNEEVTYNVHPEIIDLIVECRPKNTQRTEV